MSRLIATLALGLFLGAFLFWVSQPGEPAAPRAEPAEEFTAAEVEALRQLVEDTLLENPEIIPRAIEVLQFRREADARRAAEARAMENRAAIEDDPVAPTAGPADAEITVVEFYDYQCPYCRKAYEDVADILQSEDNVRYQFKQFPVLDRPGEPEVSRQAARYAIAADRQGKFLAWHDAVMSSEGRLSLNRLDQLAGQAGLDVEQLKEDAADPEVDAYIASNLALAEYLGFTGTPTYVINGRVVMGARGLETLKRTIAKARADMAAN